LEHCTQEGVTPELVIRDNQKLEKSIRAIYRFHNIQLTTKESNNLIPLWYKSIVKSNEGMSCTRLIELRRDDIILHSRQVKNIITTNMGCATNIPEINVLSDNAPVIAQFKEINDQTLLLAEILPLQAPIHQRFLTVTKQDYPIRLMQEHMVSINNQLDVVYQYKRDHHLVTASGRLLWMKQDGKSTLREMNLTQHYEQYRALSYSNLNNQINLARQTQPNQREIRVGNILKTILKTRRYHFTTMQTIKL